MFLGSIDRNREDLYLLPLIQLPLSRSPLSMKRFGTVLPKLTATVTLDSLFFQEPQVSET